MVHSYQRLQQKWRFQPLGGSLVYVCRPYTSEIHILYMYYTYATYSISFRRASSTVSHLRELLFRFTFHARELLERVFTPKGDWIGEVFSSSLPKQTLYIYTYNTKTSCQDLGVPANWPMKIYVDDEACCWDFWNFLTHFQSQIPSVTKRHFPLRRHRYPKWRNVHPSCDHHPSRRRRLSSGDRKSMVEARGRADH